VAGLEQDPRSGRVAPLVLITGAAGNLGSRLAGRLAEGGQPLRLMYHRTPIAGDLLRRPNVNAVRADLADPRTLPSVVAGADVVVHFAGVLFAPRPERFLPTTNTTYFANLLMAAIDARVSRVILISFPHTEGPTSVEHPATGRLDREPISVHARTRLEEERLLMTRTRGTATTPVVLRLGMVYGRGILMIEAARWLARHRLLAVWREPTLMHMLATEDFLRATAAAVLRPGVEGIYHVGDDHPVTLQEFLDEACRVWGCARPMRVPVWLVYLTAALCEIGSAIFGTRAPFTRDFISIGRVSHWGDTSRARRELIPTLEYPTLQSGLSTL
jgi:nucleoside-diphosphate-sugar epimerase